MKQIVLAAALGLAPLASAVPAVAQEGDIEEGFNLMEEGAKLLFRGLLEEMEPAIEDFGGVAEELVPALELLATEFGPAIVELAEVIDSVRYYHPPEVLPNGDIILRRREDAPPWVPPEGSEIDL